MIMDNLTYESPAQYWDDEDYYELYQNISKTLGVVYRKGEDNSSYLYDSEYVDNYDYMYDNETGWWMQQDEKSTALSLATVVVKLYIAPVFFILGLVLNVLAVVAMLGRAHLRSGERSSSRVVYLVAVAILDEILLVREVVESPSLGAGSGYYADQPIVWLWVKVYLGCFSGITGYLLATTVIVESLLWSRHPRCMERTNQRHGAKKTAGAVTAILGVTVAVFSGYAVYCEMETGFVSKAVLEITVAVVFQLFPTIVMLGCVVAMVVQWKRLSKGNEEVAGGGLSQPEVRRTSGCDKLHPLNIVEQRAILREELKFSAGLTILGTITIPVGVADRLDYLTALLCNGFPTWNDLNLLNLISYWSILYHVLKPVCYVVCWKDFRREAVSGVKALWYAASHWLKRRRLKRSEPIRSDLVPLSPEEDGNSWEDTQQDIHVSRDLHV